MRDTISGWILGGVGAWVIIYNIPDVLQVLAEVILDMLTH
jgi:hypothetical protein